MTTRCRGLMALLLLCGAAPAIAQTPAPRVTREVRTQLSASINNAGLQQSIDAVWRRGLTRSERAVMKDAHAALALTAAATPAGARGGAWVELAPLSIVTVRAGGETAHYFGTFNSLWSTDRRDAAFDGDARRTAGGSVSGHVTRWFVTPSLQARAGRLAVRTAVDLERWHTSAPGPYFYEPTRDALLAVSGDHTLNATTAALYETDPTQRAAWRVGLTHQWMRAGGDAVTTIQKAGVLLGWARTAGASRGIQPAVTLNVYRYLDHPSRVGGYGAAVSIGVPVWRR